MEAAAGADCCVGVDEEEAVVALLRTPSEAELGEVKDVCLKNAEIR
jgi:hypothetical protein